MKKFMIVLFVCIAINSLCARVIDPKIVEEAKANVDNWFLPTQTIFEGKMQTTVNFSQESYEVGDTVDVTIHLKVNTELNNENLNFVVHDYSIREIYTSYYIEDPSILTQERIDDIKNSINKSEWPLEFIESDPNLILNNFNPTGVYRIKFKIIGKNYGLEVNGIKYPYLTRDISITSFHDNNVEEYKYLTKYFGRGSGVNLYIKFAPSAMTDEHPLDMLERKRQERKKVEQLNLIN